MGDWLSWMDGAKSDHAVKARNEALKEVGILALASGGTSFALGAMEGYNSAKDPGIGGMPHLGPAPLDAVIGVAGLASAVFLGDKLGETGQLIALGAGLAGADMYMAHQGRIFGTKMFKPVKGAGYSKTGALKEKSTLSPETQRVYDTYMSK